LSFDFKGLVSGFSPLIADRKSVEKIAVRHPLVLFEAMRLDS
jgi:hypothetical protein